MPIFGTKKSSNYLQEVLYDKTNSLQKIIIPETGLLLQPHKVYLAKTIEEVESSHTDYVIEKVERLITMYERKEILDGKEKEYLSAVIRPFKSRIKYICKRKMYDREYINIVTYGISSRANDSMPFPLFKKGTMYKGMELDKEYTLKELGLE